MRIAMLGTRGVPANYSGFETCVEELGARLVERGHQVTVYCRSHFITHPGPTYRGMRLLKLPTIENKYLDTIVHSFLSAWHAAFSDYDIVLMFIAGNSLVSWIPRLGGKKVVLNVDGLDWKREKWPPVAKKYIQFAEFLATKLPDEIVTDSRIIERHYLENHNRPSTYIAYGANIVSVPPGKYLQKFGLEPERYVLFVGRLVPENCAHHLVQAFEKLDTEMKCVVVGHAHYAEEYIASLRNTSNANVVFTGYLFGEGYRELSSNSYLFVETSGVGGTHPALLEAMACGKCTVVHNTPENLETIGDSGLSYDGKLGADSLAEVLEKLLSSPELVREKGQLALERIKEHYSWERIADEYEKLFGRLLERK